jgi:hypothetical protein
LHKLPVFATAGRAYGFLVRELGTILRLSWLVIVLVLIVQYFAARGYYAALRQALEARDMAAFASGTTGYPWQIANLLATMAGSAIVAVALHRVILFGDRRPGQYIHLAFGKVEFLFALLPLIFYAGMAGLVFLGMLGIAMSSTPAFMALLITSMGVAFVLLAVRLTPIFPVTVVERRYDLPQTLELTRGNFWRILAAWIVVLGPAWIALAVAQFAMVGTMEPTLDALARFEAFLIPGLVLSFVTLIVFGALGVGLLSYSYKALSGLPPDAVVSPRGT